MYIADEQDFVDVHTLQDAVHSYLHSGDEHVKGSG